MQEIRVGLIGFGAIGREVAEAIHDGRAGRAELVSVLVRSPEKIEPGCARRLGCRFTTDAADFLDSAMDLVVEAAGHDALRSYAEAVLRADKDLMVAAVGAFADDGLWERVSRLAHDRGRRVYIPSSGHRRPRPDWLGGPGRAGRGDPPDSQAARRLAAAG